MTVRRRSRRRPLTDFAGRSPLQVLGVWFVKAVLVALMFLAAWLLIANWAVPSLVEGMSR